MSGSRQALFQAVLDRPDDDAPRIRFAEFLDAQGDSYGAFIRAQIERTHALRYGSDDEAWRLYDVAKRLEANYREPAWTNEVEKLVEHVQFVRGFVDRVVVDARRYLDNADELYRRAPIRHLVLTEVGDLAAVIARDLRLSQVTWVSVTGKPRIGDAGLEAIVRSPYIGRLRVLDVARQDISLAGLETLCASKSLPSLVYVNLIGNKFDDPVEGYGTDWATGRPDVNGAYLPPLGRQLEAKFGELVWLHAPSRLRHFPPQDDEF